MCERQTRKKYLERDSPPFPANKCVSKIKRGNDGKMWISVKALNGVARWKPVVKKSKSKSPKSRPRKSKTRRS